MPTSPQTILAFDIGLKRTGVAVGQSLLKTTQVAGQLPVHNGRIAEAELAKLIDKWQPQLLVIGDPKSSDPRLRKVINRLISYIQQEHKLNIVRVDETLTTDAANAELSQHALTQSNKIQLRDQMAACLILESYFASLPQND